MKETNIGKIATLAIVGTAIYLGVKNHKRDGFWTGLGVMLLLSVSVHTYKVK